MQEDLNAAHDHELPRHAQTILHIDAAQAGIGGEMAWSTVLNPEHTVKAGVYHLNLVIESVLQA